MIVPHEGPMHYAIRRLVNEWLDRAPSTLADPTGDLASHLERWVRAGCPVDPVDVKYGRHRRPCVLDPSDPCGTCAACEGRE